MTVARGTRFGPYEVLGPLGAGGMGEVWRAEDARLGREVALKLLPEDFAADPERHARFEREAKLLASLNHPNIATLYGLEQLDGRHFLVMELVEGEDLSARIARGPIPVEETIPIALQIAGALEAAHEAGIVHRDLKPANIKLRPDGTVKVLDFGLAKAWEVDGGSSSASLSPTITEHHTRAGVILGTAAYMSPEQARGKQVDRRADIWAFGVVLWEMLTGNKLFAGETVSDTLAAVLTRSPDLCELPDGTPPVVRQLVGRCVERDVKRRLQAIGEARIALVDAGGMEPVGGSKERPRAEARGGLRGRLMWATLVMALALAATGWWRVATGGRANVASSWVFSPLTRLPGMEIQPSLSPDGRYVAYASRIDGDWDIYLLRIGGDNPINLTADEKADDRSPAFSPDGGRIAFQSDRDGGGLFVMGATGESVKRVTGFGYNPAWSPDGRRLVFGGEAVDTHPGSRIGPSSLSIVDLETGTVGRVAMEQDAVQPAWSPNGAWIAFWGLPENSGQRDLWLVHPDGSGLRPVTSDAALDWSPSWSADGRKLYFSSDRGGTLGPWSVAIDPASGARLEEPGPLTVPATWAAEINVSADIRTVVFTKADFRSNIYRVGFDPAVGKVLGEPAPVTRGASAYWQIDPSPDGKWVAATTTANGETITLIRADGSAVRGLTDDGYHNRGPKWSPDGDRLLFYSDRSGSYQVHSVRPDGSSLELVTDVHGGVVLPFWSPDGRRLLVNNMSGSVSVVDLGPKLPVTKADMLPLPPGVKTLQGASWTADGRGVLVAGTRGSTSAGSLLKYDLESKRFRLITDRAKVRMDFHDGLPVALRDGRRVVFSNRNTLSLLDIATGRVRTILTPPPGVRYVGPRMGPDERSIFFLRLEEEADLWVARRARPEEGR